MEQWERDTEGLKIVLREARNLNLRYSSLSKVAYQKLVEDMVEAKLKDLLCSINSSQFGLDTEFKLSTVPPEEK